MHNLLFSFMLYYFVNAVCVVIELFYLLNFSQTSESSACLASLCPGGRHNAPTSSSWHGIP